jgi:hypothetical protein
MNPMTIQNELYLSAQPVRPQETPMRRAMYTVDEVKGMVVRGEKLSLAGDERLLSQLPAGNWIGGTAPGLQAEREGQFLLAARLPDYVSALRIQTYDKSQISAVYQDAPEHGFSLIILPYNSKVHLAFAVDVPQYPAFATRPLIGWVAGTYSGAVPKVFNGCTRQAFESRAVVMHISLPREKVADICMLNCFEPGGGDVLTFPEDGFSVEDVLVNGNRQNFTDYLIRTKADIDLPLVANYCGALVNVSFRSVNRLNKRVELYAPVFKGRRYQLARPGRNWTEKFSAGDSPMVDGSVVFSCSSRLNYFSAPEERPAGGALNPISFGEIAYQLLNQTMVYLTVNEMTPSE